MKDPEKYRVNHLMPYGKGYMIQHPRTRAKLVVIAAEEPGGWNHVSVSLKNRIPTWDEMCFIKNVFFDDEELCIQFHPKKSQYVNLHPNCLHLWNPPPSVVSAMEWGFMDGTRIHNP